MEVPHPTDAELVGLAQAGQVQALAALQERYRASLYAAAVRLLRDRDEARDAVQDTVLVALTRLDSLRDPAAVGGWLHRILRNTCFTYRRRSGRLEPTDRVEVAGLAPSPEEVVERLALGDWVWQAIDALAPDDRLTVMLRYFARCHTYESIAEVTGVPVGTVRSRLHRSRSQLGDRLMHSMAGSELSQAERERQQRAEWEGFYAELHGAPEPRTYRHTHALDVQVSDGRGHWQGLVEWSDHEREAITLGVRAEIVGLVAGTGVTVLEIDFTNPPSAGDHCPPAPRSFTTSPTNGHSGSTSATYDRSVSRARDLRSVRPALKSARDPAFGAFRRRLCRGVGVGYPEGSRSSGAAFATSVGPARQGSPGESTLELDEVAVGVRRKDRLADSTPHALIVPASNARHSSTSWADRPDAEVGLAGSATTPRRLARRSPPASTERCALSKITILRSRPTYERR